MNTDLFTYKIYTVRELRDWLIDNVQNGLTEYCIAPTRAYAFVNNPCANDNDPALVVAFKENQPVGYSAVFTDVYKTGNLKGTYYWGSTEWVDTDFRGKGIAGKMMRTLKDAVGIDNYIGLDSSIASIRLDQKQGASILYYDRYNYFLKGSKSLTSLLKQIMVQRANKKALQQLERNEFKNEYVNFIDAQTYQFIAEHAEEDLLLRGRDMLNWMLCYPFLIGTHNDPKAKTDICEFGSTMAEYDVEAVKVYVQDKLVGFYIISQTNNERTLRYLYYDEQCREEVFASVTLNLFRGDVAKLHFMEETLHQFMQAHGIKHLNRKSYLDKISLTLPPSMTVDSKLHIQGGDGDMFC